MTFTEKVLELERLRAEAILYIYEMSRRQLKRFLTIRRKYELSQTQRSSLSAQAPSEVDGAPSE
jgi:hypothetical protein